MEDEDIEVLIAMNNFAALGVQRVFIKILNNWPESGPAVGLSLHNTEGRFESQFDAAVPVFELDKIQRPIPGIRAPFRVLAYYRLLKQVQPETVIAVNQFESLALCLVKRFYDDFDLVVSENCHVTSNIERADAHEGWFGWYYRNRFRHEYNTYADVVHTVAEEAAEDLIHNHGIREDKVEIIYNPVDIEHIRAEADAREPDHPWLGAENNTVINVSRLTSQKRVDILLKAWAELKDTEPADTNPPYRLVVVGDGEERDALEELTQELGIEDSVDFVGFKQNPWPAVKQATLLASTSEWEGLPLTLIETQAVGTAIVASDCPSGPKEILLCGDAGFLFPKNDVAACAETLESALTAPEERRRRVEAATAALDRFAVETVVEEFVDLVQ
ncbi:glycosyltransferase [Natronomonas halophila]|uniref:glycosyltransferase n=1 Tax=Natronomonas halophila TaxID=2747817 RepID=UPI0015B45FA6|nr:glycosyltransferase [Natronomonas halophila]QLD86836.1 glycosyltransferase [Natronomonas halophila]